MTSGGQRLDTISTRMCTHSVIEGASRRESPLRTSRSYDEALMSPSPRVVAAVGVVGVNALLLAVLWMGRGMDPRAGNRGSRRVRPCLPAAARLAGPRRPRAVRRALGPRPTSRGVRGLEGGSDCTDVARHPRRSGRRPTATRAATTWVGAGCHRSPGRRRRVGRGGRRCPGAGRHEDLVLLHGQHPRDRVAQPPVRPWNAISW